MQSGPDHLAVRRHSRIECELPASLRVGDLHAAQVVFSRAVSEGDGSIPVRVVDCSKGGLGLRTGVYLPRGTSLVVSFALPEGGGEHEMHLRVQRSSMVGREPTYYLGTSLIDRPGAAQSLAAILRWAESLGREGAA